MLKQLEHYLNKHENPVVACSFGKDSLVVLHQVLQIRPSVAVVFNNTKCEFPGTLRLKRRLVEQWNLNLVEAFPSDGWTFWKVVEKYGFPLGARKGKGAVTKCCYYLKKTPMKRIMREYGWDLVIDGMTIHENRQRWMALKRYWSRWFRYVTSFLLNPAPPSALDPSQTAGIGIIKAGNATNYLQF